MKRILFLLSLVALAGIVAAQSDYYHRVGDTVRGRCPIYHYERGWWPILNATGHTDSVIGTFGTFGYMKHTTNTPLKVIGVASTVARLDRTNMQEDLDTSIDGTLYYVLFDATAGGLVEKARVCWTDDYLTHPKRYMELPRRGGAASCDQMQDFTAIVPLREYYFDSAITVTDSFYLGCATTDPTVTDFNSFSYIASHMWDYCAYAVSPDGTPNPSLKPCAMEVPEFTYYDSSRLDNQWHHFTHKRFQLIFPIIEVDTVSEMDTVCTAPGEPHVASRDSLKVRVEWTDTASVRWEVSRTEPDGDPEAGLITPTTTPYIEYTDIDDHLSYSVYVRGLCTAGTWEGWSDWSTPCAIDSIPTSGINPLEADGLTLFPNPTDGSVQILGLQAEVATIEILDTKGRVLQTFNGTFAFNVSTLPSGTYVVRIRTRHDNAAEATLLKLVKK